MTKIRRIGAFGRATLMGVLLVAASCGGGSAQPDGGGTGAAGNGNGGTSGGTTPPDLCRNLVATLCTRLNTCGAMDGSAQDMTDCNTLENVEFGCERATSPAFPACLSDVKVVSCAALFPASGNGSLAIPASCDAPLNSIPLSAAQMKCADLAGVICDKLNTCQGGTFTADDILLCQQDVFSTIGCGFAVDVSSTYAQCLTDFPKSTCDSRDAGAGDGGMMGSVPSCVGVIKGPLP